MNNPAIEPIAKKYIELRYQLLSYNYTLTWEARETGMPMMRSLWLHYPKDKQARSIGDQYLWGRDMLIAPVYEKGATTRDVYLPAGKWYDWWTGKLETGGRTVQRAVDLATMPIYVRAGAIVPVDPIRQYTGQKVDEPTTLKIYRGANGNYTLYDDEVEEQPMFQTRNAFVQITATYLDSTPTRVKLKLPRGDVQEIPMFYFGSPPIHYFLSKMAKIPETVTDHQMEPGRRKLISLDASKMELGKLKEWKNAGALKGGFIPMNYAPTVVDFEGHRGVRFEVDRAKYAEPEFQALTSTFTVTDYLGYEAPFTFSALIHCDEQENLDTTPIMSWGALCGDQQTTLNLGTSEVAGLAAMDGKGPGGAEGWYYMTYVYTGGHDGKLSIYRNGELLSEHQYDVKIERRPTTDITATSATLNAELFSKSGSGSTRVYYGEEDHFNGSSCDTSGGTEARS